jgi:hypothetical protein
MLTPLQAPNLLLADATEKHLYWDQSHSDSPDAPKRAVCQSKTVYVGNLAFSTRATVTFWLIFDKVGGGRGVVAWLELGLV